MKYKTKWQSKKYQINENTYIHPYGDLFDIIQEPKTFHFKKEHIWLRKTDINKIIEILEKLKK